MSKSIWPLVLLSLTACEPKVSPEAVTQTLRVGNLEVNISAPQWVKRQAFYPVKVTYTNKGQEAVTFSDILNCSYLHVRDSATGQVPRQSNYGCTTEGIPPVILAPNKSYSGTSRGIIDQFAKGHYVIFSQDLRGLRPSLEITKNHWERPEFTPTPQEIRFQIR